MPAVLRKPNCLGNAAFDSAPGRPYGSKLREEAAGEEFKSRKRAKSVRASNCQVAWSKKIVQPASKSIGKHGQSAEAADQNALISPVDAGRSIWVSIGGCAKPFSDPVLLGTTMLSSCSIAQV